MEKDEIWENYKKQLFELKIKEGRERLKSKDKLTTSKEIKEELEALKKEMRIYLFNKKKEGKIK